MKGDPMTIANTFTRTGLAAGFALAVLTAVPAFAQPAASGQAAPAASDYVPKSGQAGKDVVWVPTHDALVQRMLDMAQVTPNDYLVDLGSGDGRTVIAAAKRGLRALGVEYNGDLVTLSQRNAEREGVTDKARFVRGDIFETDFSDATVVTLFLLPQLNLRLRPTLLAMKPGTRVVSNSFRMDDWIPDQEMNAGSDCTQYCSAMLWIIPAKVEGTWRFDGGQIALEQKFQMLTGTITRDGKAVPISDGKMTGADIAFTAGGERYAGRVEDGRMELKAGGGSGRAISATRAGS
jgi:SAM-dependent methyltransferase